MNETIINGIFALSGTLVAGLISYIIARSAKETKTLKSQVNMLSKPTKTILQEYREKIESMDLERPTMTQKEAKRILTKNT